MGDKSSGRPLDSGGSLSMPLSSPCDSLLRASLLRAHAEITPCVRKSVKLKIVGELIYFFEQPRVTERPNDSSGCGRLSDQQSYFSRTQWLICKCRLVICKHIHGVKLPLGG